MIWVPVSLRRRGILAAAIGSTALSAGLPVAQAADIGRPAPAFRQPDTAGKPVDTSGFPGRILVLEWTNPICPFAGKHYKSGNMQSLQQLVRDAGGAWYSVISHPLHTAGYVDELEAEQLAEDRQSRADGTLLDTSTSLARLYGARATPHLFIADRAGLLAYAGGMDSIASTKIDDIARAVPHARQALEAVIAGSPVPHPVTRPYGCPIKYLEA